MYKLSNRSYNNLEGVKPILIGIATEAIRSSPYDFGIANNGGFRTAKEQNELYKIGRRGIEGEKKVTELDGFKKKSYHQSGFAFDVFGYYRGKATWKESIMIAIGKHIQKIAKERFFIELEWGGEWQMKDYPHFEIR